MLVNLSKQIYRVLYLGVVVVAFVPVWPLLIFWGKNPRRNFKKIVWARFWIAKVSSILAGIRFKIRYQTPIDWSQTYILCANHTSNLDIPAMILTHPSEFVFVGKTELLQNPVTRIFFESIDIPLDRNSKMSAFRSFRKAAEYLKEGKSIIIFPEGKIGDDYPPELCPFKSGPFRLAIEHKVSILPIVIQNAWELFWDDAKKHGARPGTVRVDVLEPISTIGLDLKDTDHLMQHTHQLIRQHWDIYR